MGTPLLWIGFNVLVLVMLAIDLGLNREAKAITTKQAAIWTVVWIGMSFVMAAAIWRWWGRDPALQFTAAYLLEKSLSVDNLFVFLLVFSYFKVPPEDRHRVLYWGILGAFVMRAGLILVGAALVKRFEVLLAVFGAFLLYTAAKMAFSKDEGVDPEHSAILRLGRRLLPISQKPAGHHFTVMEDGRRKFTPLFLVLLVVEGTDLLFALDSIPAALGISSDAFIVYTSNVCAILGLRSLFFMVASLLDKFHYLKIGLSVVLAFIGAKMVVTWVSGELFEHKIHVPTWLSLTVIGVVLAISIVVSMLRPAAGPSHKVEPDRT